ncbi:MULTISPECIES: hypothetical protein [Microcystis]|uniref:Uncharacterized protein n=3 Tax=Microcystis TaxID=1125 RepID=A0A0A1W0L9_MICAE|nr:MULTISPECIES: hypothetical protein [Microcystis]MDT3673726.1 hypothetical protein [Microcystis wesenbergii NRERC-220]OPF16075.1 hypothetical protein B1L04_27280 [Microcystis aeruginosa KW]GAL95071.1 hypothetical protein N44_03926 [Microcystis aeruginosa NIES-44]
MSINQLNALSKDFMPIFLIFELSKINQARTLLITALESVYTIYSPGRNCSDYFSNEKRD